MKKQLLIAACASILCACGGTTMSQNTQKADVICDGRLEGVLDLVIQKLPLVLNLSHDESGNPVCTMESPSQSKDKLPAVIDHWTADSLAVSVPMIGLTYRGGLHDGAVVGVFNQNGIIKDMTMEYVTDSTATIIRRPQTPKPPYPYTCEEVSAQNGSITLSGTLTLPEGFDPQRPVPVVVMVTGSGAQNRDSEILQHKPFLVIADYLAKNGIASFRYDDRGVGKSTGDFKSAVTKNFASDAEACLNKLRSDRRFSKIGVLGHSEGGQVAFMLSGEGKTDFAVTLGAPGVKGVDLMEAQCNRIMELQGRPERITGEQYRQMNANQSAWLDAFLDYDPSGDIRNTKCPVLALNGDKDCQVISSQNLEAIKKLLPKNDKNLCKEYPGLNHLFQHCETGAPNEYQDIEETISPEVLADIAGWINAL